MKYRHLISAMILGLSLAPSFSAMAQDAGLSADEIKKRFENQKTRGLVVAPAGDAAPVGTEGGTSVAVTPAADGYVAQDASDQVNIAISFDFDSATLREDQKPKLASMCEAMKSVDVQVFRIIGHTDAAGSDSYNQRLSQLRAEEVKRHLVSECGIDAARLEAVGVGKAHLLDTENPRADANRRVEFQVVS